VHGVEIATRANHAIVKPNDIKVPRRREHWLDFGNLLVAIKFENLAPNELHAHLSLQNWLQSERKAIKMGRLHKGTKHTWRVFKEFLRIHDGHMEVLFQILGCEIAGELPTDNETSALLSSHC